MNTSTSSSSKDANAANLEKAIVKNYDLPSIEETASLPPDPTLVTKVAALDLQDSIQEKQDSNFKPPEKSIPSIARKLALFTDLAKIRLKPRQQRITSTFTPTAFNYFQVVHHTDQLIAG